MIRLLLRASAVLSLAAAGAAAAASELPAPLEAALANQPESVKPERVALRMTVNRASILVEIRPGQAERERRYTLLQPADEASLTEEQAEMWAGFSTDEADGDDLSPGEGDDRAYWLGAFDSEALREAIGGQARFEREIDGRRVYSFDPESLPGQGGDAGERAALLDNLRAEIEIDPEREEVHAVRFDLIESFKPNFAARMREFSLEHRFVHEPAVNGPRFSGMTMSMAGAAVFQPFNQTMDIELVSVRYPAASALEGEAESP